MRAHSDVSCVGVCFILTRRVLCIVLCYRHQCRHSSGLTIPVPIFGDWGTFSLTSVSNGDTLQLAWFIYLLSLMRTIILEALLPPSHWPLTLEIWSGKIFGSHLTHPDQSRLTYISTKCHLIPISRLVLGSLCTPLDASRRLHTFMPSSLTNID